MRRPGSIIHLKKIIRKVVYRLKWLYGQPADVYRETQGDYNPETGERTVVWTKYHIVRMIVMPGMVHRDFFFSISVIRANSQFITGGDVNLSDRQFIIDTRDLPVDFVLTVDDYVIWKDERWDFKSVEALDANTAYVCIARRIDNQIVNQIHDGRLRTVMTVTSEFTGSKN